MKKNILNLAGLTLAGLLGSSVASAATTHEITVGTVFSEHKEEAPAPTTDDKKDDKEHKDKEHKDGSCGDGSCGKKN